MLKTKEIDVIPFFPSLNLCLGGESFRYSVLTVVLNYGRSVVFWIRKSVKNLFPPVMSDIRLHWRCGPEHLIKAWFHEMLFKFQD